MNEPSIQELKFTQFYRSYKMDQCKDVTLIDVFDEIRSPIYKRHITYIRTITDRDLKNKEKMSNLPVVAFGGTFDKNHKEEYLIKATGLISIDIDKLTPEDTERVKKIFIDDKYNILTFISPSGNGIKGLFYCSTAVSKETYTYAWGKISQYFKETYNLEVDPATKNINRLCFLSHDIDAALRLNAEEFKVDTLIDMSSIPKGPGVDVKNILGGVAEGSRNDSLYKLALSLFTKGVTSGDVMSMLDNANNNSVPRLSTNELIKIRNSAHNMHKKNKKKEVPYVKEITQVTEHEIILPKLGKNISRFSYELGSKYRDKREIFYRVEDKTVVNLEYIPLNKEGDKKIIGFKIISAKQFITLVEEQLKTGDIIKVEESDGTKKDRFKEKSMSVEVAGIVLESEQFKKPLPMITRIFSVPIPMLQDNELKFPKVGYDEDLLSWLPEDAPTIDETMPLERAKEILLEIFKEFCFKTEQDRTNAIAALITPALRGLYSRYTCRTPIFFFEANRERAGKDCCAGVRGMLYYGAVVDETPISDGKAVHNEEFRKKITSALMAGRKRVHSANNKGHLDSAELEALATNENWTDRMLGGNKTLNYSNDLEISLSANIGITYTPDLANRCVFINLFLSVEDPNSRKFQREDLHTWVKENRSIILSAIYCVIKNWYDLGMPPGDTVFSSYPEWARVCGGVMKAAGLGDPCKKNVMDTIIGGDKETNDMKRLFELLFDEWKDGESNKTKFHLKKEIVALITSKDEFGELFMSLDWNTNNASARTKFGFILEKYVGRTFSDITLIKLENPRADRCTYQFVKNSLPFDGGTLVGRVGRDGTVEDHSYHMKINNVLLRQADATPNGANPANPTIKMDEIRCILHDNPSGFAISKLIAMGFENETILRALKIGDFTEIRAGIIVNSHDFTDAIFEEKNEKIY